MAAISGKSFIVRKPFVVAAGFSLFLVCPTMLSAQSASTGNRPSIVELFTSEGCSSCPPADAQLAQLAREMPGVILLSEHVTYWNYLGWTDPFSLDDSTRRQEDYANQFRGEGPYTPQMVVNGTQQFVGGDGASLRHALVAGKELQGPHLSVSLLPAAGNRSLRAAMKLPASAASGRLIAVLVQNEGHAEVSRGENGGRTLTHVDIAREFRSVAKVTSGTAFEGEVSFTLPAGADAKSFHIVVFLQSEAGGAVLAAGSSTAA